MALFDDPGVLFDDNSVTFEGAFLNPFTQGELDYLLAYMQENLMIPTAAEIAAAILAAAETTPIHADVKQTNGEVIIGDGTEGNKFRSHLVG